MPTKLTSDIFNDMVKIVVLLICDTDGITLVNFSDKLETFIKKISSEGKGMDNLKKLLSSVEDALQKNDLISLLDVLYSFSKSEGIKIIA